MTKLWKKGRGKLGFLDPLIGSWRAKTISENGPVECVRTFKPILKDGYVQLIANWKVGPAPARKASAKPEAGSKRDGANQAAAGADMGSKPGTSYTYDELALIGTGGERNVRFWSFTSDGKQTYGVAADASDLHPEAIGFEATVMGRQARQAYYPAENGDVIWVVEAKAKKGWNRFVEHRYKRIETKVGDEKPVKADEKSKKVETRKV
jgi:hypothetical protein